jgi:hypothetical protein
MNLRAAWRYVIPVVAALAAIGAVSLIEVDVPPEFSGELRATGQIIECEFRSIGLRGGDVFVGIRLGNPAQPLLRLNAPAGDRSKYEALCTRRANVAVSYRAVQRIFGPLRFWVHELAEA